MFIRLFRLVAPHAGAWIEISPDALVTVKPRTSHPTRVRGLKSSALSAFGASYVSHPTRVRGLKCLAAQTYAFWRARRTPRGCVD